jgi:hypothetical protein
METPQLMTSQVVGPGDSCRLATTICATALSAGLVCLSACGPGITPPADCSTDGDALPPTEPLPDLGPDALVCGEPGDLALTDEEVAALAGCQIFRGDLSVGRDVTDLSPLASLRVIEGRFGSQAYDLNLETLDGLDELEVVGEFSFHADGLRDLTGVRNLREVEGSFRFAGMANLTDLHGLQRLETTGDLELIFNRVLVSVDGLSSLRQVDGDLLIAENPELRDLSCLGALERVTGDVGIGSNPKLPAAHIERLVSRIEVGGEVHVD